MKCYTTNDGIMCDGRSTSAEMYAIREKAYQQGGFRERYAMDNGTEREVEFGGDRCLRYDYDRNDPYQDANGAMYDIDRGCWIYQRERKCGYER